MYSESDLDSAVMAGAISPDAAAALRAHAASLHATSLVDEEHFRLISGFNDIFVTIAGVLLLVALAWLGGDVRHWLGGAAVAACAWGLAEYFTRRRRMALPSILFLLAFVGGVFATAATLLIPHSGPHFGASDMISALLLALSGAIAAGAAWLHWRRFRVPITVAAGAAALVATVFGLLLAAFPAMKDHWTPVMFVCGLGVFALAMWWDISDRDRLTRRSDVAFWLHLLAAPMLVHPTFQALGILDNQATMITGGIVVILYVALGLIALAIDRRALMVSALAYVLIALSSLFQQLGAIGLNVALTGLVIGSALLLLSAFWHDARAMVVSVLPSAWRDRLPLVGRPAPALHAA